MNSTEKSLRGRSAANTRWAKATDRTTTAKSGMAGLLARFEREVDPEGVLTPEVRRERALQLRKAHMQKMTMKSVIARRVRARTAEAREKRTPWTEPSESLPVGEFGRMVAILGPDRHILAFGMEAGFGSCDCIVPTSYEPEGHNCDWYEKDESGGTIVYVYDYVGNHLKPGWYNVTSGESWVDASQLGKDSTVNLQAPWDSVYYDPIREYHARLVYQAGWTATSWEDVLSEAETERRGVL